MLSFLCCKATSVVDTSTELFTAAKEKVQGGVNEFTQAQLRDALVGEPAFLAHEAPDVSVVITEVILKDGVELSSVNAFILKGVHCKVEVKVQGTKTQMAGMVAAHQAGKLFDVVSQGEKYVTGALGVAHIGLAGKAAASTSGARDSLRESAVANEESQVLQFDIVLDLEKVVGVEQVDAKVVSISSATEAINRAISMEMLKKYLETAASQRASRIVTDWQNQTFTFENAKSKGAVLIASGVAKGGEMLEAGKAKGGELVNAKAQGAVLISSRVAKGGDLIESSKARGCELIDSMRAKMER